MSNIDTDRIATAAPAALNSVTRNQQLTKLWEKTLLDNATSFQERSISKKTDVPITVPDLNRPGKQYSTLQNLAGDSNKPVMDTQKQTNVPAANISSSTVGGLGKTSETRSDTPKNLMQAPQNNVTRTVDRFKSSIHRSNFLSHVTENSNAQATTPSNYLVVTHENEVKVWFRSKDGSSGLDLLKQLRTSFSSIGFQLVSMTVNGENIYSKNNDPQRLNADEGQENAAGHKFNQVM